MLNPSKKGKDVKHNHKSHHKRIQLSLNLNYSKLATDILLLIGTVTKYILHVLLNKHNFFIYIALLIDSTEIFIKDYTTVLTAELQNRRDKLDRSDNVTPVSL